MDEATDGWERVPIFLPHDYIAELQKQPPDTIQRVLFGEGGVDDVGQYWNKMRSHEWCAGHPAHEAADVTVPMEIFGDDATIWKNQSLLILTMKSALAEGKTFDTTLLLAVLPLNRVLPDKTLPDLYRAVAWSFTMATQGLWPTLTHTGEPMRKEHGARRYINRGTSLGVLRLGLCRVTGDWKFLKETYHLHAYNANACCHMCNANKSPDEGPLYTDTGPTAAWRASPRTHAQFMQEQSDSGSLSPLTAIPGWRLEMIKTDLMHNMCLGSAQHLIGSVIVQLVLEGHWGQHRGRRPQCLIRGFNLFRAWKNTQNTMLQEPMVALWADMNISTSLPTAQGQGTQHARLVGMDARAGHGGGCQRRHRGILHAGREHMGVGQVCVRLGQIPKTVTAIYGHVAATNGKPFLEHVHVVGQTLPT